MTKAYHIGIQTAVVEFHRAFFHRRGEQLCYAKPSLKLHGGAVGTIEYLNPRTGDLLDYFFHEGIVSTSKYNGINVVF